MTPMRYALAAEDKKIFKKLIVLTWIVAVLFGLTVLKDVGISAQANFGATLFTVVTIVICYIVIIITVQRSRKAVRGSENEDTARRSSKHLLVPGLIFLRIS